MLQQTQASRVAPVFERFVQRFPNLEVLADASVGDVVRAWAGLGYHRRAVALHASAVIVVRDHGGAIPSDLTSLRALPGVGDYTAAAVASLAFGRPVAAIDTNVRRILTRLVHGAGADTVPAARLRDDAQAWLDPGSPAAWNQALMDLGRAVCRPAPRCPACPLRPWCRFPLAAPEGAPGRREPSQPTAPFEGSMRQVRGAVVAHLRVRSPSTVGAVVRAVGADAGRVTDAIAGLAADGVVAASPAARRGRPRARVALPS